RCASRRRLAFRARLSKGGNRGHQYWLLHRLSDVHARRAILDRHVHSCIELLRRRRLEWPLDIPCARGVGATHRPGTTASSLGSDQSSALRSTIEGHSSSHADALRPLRSDVSRLTDAARLRRTRSTLRAGEESMVAMRPLHDGQVPVSSHCRTEDQTILDERYAAVAESSAL